MVSSFLQIRNAEIRHFFRIQADADMAKLIYQVFRLKVPPSRTGCQPARQLRMENREFTVAEIHGEPSRHLMTFT